MVLKGTVRNVIDFGAFVDIGVHQDGLVHISRMSDRFIKHPLEAVSVGDIVDVQVVDLDLDKQRIALSMRIGRDVDQAGKPTVESSGEKKAGRKRNSAGGRGDRGKRRRDQAGEKSKPVNSDLQKALAKIKL